MSYEILSARLGNAERNAVVLQTSDAGEVHLDLTVAADHPQVNNREARAAYEAWLKGGNVPAAFVESAPPPPRRDLAAELDALNSRVSAVEQTRGT